MGERDSLAGLHDVVAMDIGGTHWVALKRDGTVETWFYPDYDFGQGAVPDTLKADRRKMTEQETALRQRNGDGRLRTAQCAISFR